MKNGVIINGVSYKVVSRVKVTPYGKLKEPACTKCELGEICDKLECITAPCEIFDDDFHETYFVKVIEK